jgi:NAD-dependent dihydropyrimidine dehydrogenase PreA subunit
MEMLTDKDDDGQYVIPKIIYSDAYSSEMVAFADLILPDTTYLERHDCISLLDRPISEPEALCDSIRWPVVEPDRDVRGFQSVLLDLGARLKLPGFVDEDGAPVYKDYADYIVNHQRKPGIGPLSGWRGEERRQDRARRAQPGPAQALHREWRLLEVHVPEEAQYFKHANRAYQRLGDRTRAARRPGGEHLPALSRTVAQVPACGRRQDQAGAAGASPRADQHLFRSAANSGIRRLPMTGSMRTLIRCTRSPSVRRRCIIPGARRMPGCGRSMAKTRSMCPAMSATSQGLETATGPGVLAPSGEIRVKVRRMDAVNGSTLWTWNAIGKRKGAWALVKDAPEATRGFLLNHLIHELLPPKGDGLRWANSDPITGQAAWFDLAGVDPPGSGPGQRAKPARCRRAKQPGRTGAGQCGLRTGVARMTSLPQTTEKRLGLVIDLDTCVGCHACAVNCKEWNTGARRLAAGRHRRLWRRPVRRLAQPDPHLRGDARTRRRRSCISPNPACIATTRLA